MKKLCTLFLVLTLSLASLTGCDVIKSFFSDDNAEEKVSNVVTGFLDSMLSLELKVAAGYTTDPQATMETFPFDSPRTLDDQLPELLPSEFKDYANDMIPMIDPLLAYIQEKSSYEILSVKQKEKDYLVDVKVSFPSTENLTVDTLLQNKSIQTIAVNLALGGKINLSMSQEQIIGAMLPYLANDLSKILTELNLPTTTQNITFTLVKVNTGWRIDLEKTVISDAD